MNENLDEREDDIEDGEPEIEIVDDVPETEKPRVKAKAEPEGEADSGADDDDDELEGYSEKVQKRLKKLTFKYREAERREQEAARLREEAVTYAQRIAEENKKLRESVEQGQGAYVERSKKWAEAEVDKAKRAFREAYDSGDSEALADAQAALTKAQTELYRYENYRPQPVRSSVEERNWSQPAQPRDINTPQLTPLQQDWMQRNQWFGKDTAMTGFAYGVHEELVKRGVDPNSKTYYDAIDSEVRKRFAEKFSTPDDDDGESFEVDVAPRKKPASVVAPAQRSAKTPRKIRLTSTQVALARRLGLTPEQYAAQMLKESKV